MKIMKAAILFFLVCMQTVYAGVTPHGKIDQVTVELIAAIEEGKQYYDDEPSRFYQKIDTLIDPLFDFPSFTRAVMGPFGQRSYYSSLNAEQKQQFKEDYKRFVSVFKNSLIQTYAKGLLAFSGEKIEVLPPSKDDQNNIAAGEAVAVKQEIAGEDKTLVISYKMKADKRGEWMVRNVTIDSVNVGQLYQNQFVAAMKKHHNNFSVVIDNWMIEIKEIKTEQASI